MLCEQQASFPPWSMKTWRRARRSASPGAHIYGCPACLDVRSSSELEQSCKALEIEWSAMSVKTCPRNRIRSNALGARGGREACKAAAPTDEKARGFGTVHYRGKPFKIGLGVSLGGHRGLLQGRLKEGCTTLVAAAAFWYCAPRCRRLPAACLLLVAGFANKDCRGKKRHEITGPGPGCRRGERATVSILVKA